MKFLSKKLLSESVTSRGVRAYKELYFKKYGVQLGDKEALRRFIDYTSFWRLILKNPVDLPNQKTETR